MSGDLQYTEVYTLIGSATGEALPVEATVEYYASGPENWVVMTIPSFTKNDVTFSDFRFEGAPSFTVNTKILFQEALVNANNAFTQVVATPPSFKLKSTTEPLTPIAQPTPQQVNETTQKETDAKTNEQAVTEVTKPDTIATEQNTPPTLKPTGKDKFAILLNQKRSEIKRILIPLILGLAIKAGIKYIGTPKVQFPDFCQSPEELRKMIALRNQIVNKLNQIIRVIDTFSKILTGFGIAVIIILRAKQILNTTRKAASIAVKFIPSPPGTPGFITSLLNDLKDIVEKINTKYAGLAGVIASASLSLSLIKKVLVKIVRMLNDLDKYLSKCSPDAELTPLDENLIALEQLDTLVEETPNENTYNGFILEIIEEPFSPTVSRRKAVAKNKDGIILLSTPLSFTTLNEVLIEEIKLIIDANNLKAD